MATAHSKRWSVYLAAFTVATGTACGAHRGSDLGDIQSAGSAEKPRAGTGGATTAVATGSVSTQGTPGVGGGSGGALFARAASGVSATGGTFSAGVSGSGGASGTSVGGANADLSGSGGGKTTGAAGTVGLGTGGSGGSAKPCESGTVNGTRAQELVAQGALLLDVRSTSEFAGGALPGAINIPGSELSSRLDELPTNRTIVTYCQSGSRSASAATLLRNKGFTVCNLGPMRAWSE
jgi:rhodanese-related sulfurtransferase